ncbi:MAG: deoxyribonuclease IV [Candidatus Kerfeldbacteria bacterium]|nr:deoxyribonuclease IV [Candidatus Kerfeldbacteria bacterium]
MGKKAAKKIARPRVGAHVSSAGGAQNAPVNAHAEGCEVFQFFSRPPQGGKAPVLTPEIVRNFKVGLQKYSQTAYIHAPYFINLASATPRIRYGSISVLREELERGSQLGVKAMMTHIGSARDFGEKKAMRKVIDGVQEILKGYTGTTQFCVEMSAGAGDIIGDTFEELAEILSATDRRVGVCLDTCHAFASGYDLRTSAAVKKTLSQFDEVIGLEKLVVVHMNDSKGAFGERKDRHEHIGKGQIGEEGVRALLHHPEIRKRDVILETPFEGRVHDISVLKRLR